MIILYTIEAGGKPRGPLSGHQVLKLFDAGEVTEDSPIRIARDADGVAGGPARPLGESQLFARFDQLRGAAATRPSVFLGEMARTLTAQAAELTAQAGELHAIRNHLLWMRITMGLVILIVTLYGIRITSR